MEDTTLECYFSFDLKDCKNCLFSANLRHKQYCIFNQQYSKEEYFKKLEELNLGNYDGFQKALEIYVRDTRNKFPMRANYQVNCENCEGSTHENSKNLRYCFNCTDCEDSAYCFQMDATYSSMDSDFMGYDRSELCYQVIGCSGIFNCMGCDSCWHDNDLFYCQLCFSSKNCFGCISLKQKEYCILNKQYSKEAFDKLRLTIIEHMKKTGEWGDFFPTAIAPFQYHETVAEEHFPKHVISQTREISGNEAFHMDINHVTDSILNAALPCAKCQKSFKIIPQELNFYREMKLPIPRKCPICRYTERYNFRRPRGIFKRPCAKCGTEVKSCYSSNKPKIVYCEKCYLEVVY